MNNSAIKTGVTLLLISGLVWSCKKNIKSDNAAATDNSIAEFAFNDMYLQFDQALRTNDTVYRMSAEQDILSCATVSINPGGNVWPKEVTVDLGNDGCTGTDSRFRRGKLHAVITGRYREPGTVITITPENYYVNNYLVEGVKTITNLGINAAGNLNFGISVQNGKISDGTNTITWNSTRNREWVEGESTVFILMDDVYHITGDADGISADGEPFTVTITSPLKVALDCRWIKSGSFDLQVSDHPVRSVDYGSGSCDNQATLTIKKRTYNITLQ